MSDTDALTTARNVMGQIKAMVREVSHESFEQENGLGAPAARWVPNGYTTLTKAKYELGEMLHQDDGAFIANAYRVLLKREPDLHAGELLNSLRSGEKTKVEILGGLRFSEEGMQHCVHVNGLLLPYKISLWRRKGLLGAVLSWFTSIPKNAVWHRRHELDAGRNAANIQSLGKNLNELAGLVEKLSRRVDSEASRLTSELELFAGDVQSVVGRIDRFEVAHDTTVSEFKELSDRVDGVFREREAASRKSLELGMDGMYAAFEDRFRGNRELIRERVAHYVDFVADKVGEDRSYPVLDLGCGRGEWLELLKERGFATLGVEQNVVFVEISRGIGLNVSASDILAFLKGVPDDSIGTVSMFHVVEHLPLEYLLEVLDECLRVLKNGGGLILETPNPANAIVAQVSFYMDPTHRNPIPSTLLHWLVTSRGFSDVTLVELFESRTLPPAPSIPEGAYKDAIETLMQPRREALDYAICATKRSSRLQVRGA